MTGIMRKLDIRDICPKCDEETLLVSKNKKFVFCTDIQCLWNVETEIWIELWEDQYNV